MTPVLPKDSSMNELRIKARLDKAAASDLDFLCQTLDANSITDVVKYAIKKLAQELRDNNQAKRQKQIWLNSGFFGGFEACEDLSFNYKQYSADILDEKYP